MWEEPVFPSDEVAYIAGFLTGTAVAGFVLMVFGVLLHRHTSRQIKLADEAADSSIKNDEVDCKAALTVPSIPQRETSRRVVIQEPEPELSREREPEPEWIDPTANDRRRSQDGLRLRSRSGIYRTALGQEFFQQIESGLKHGEFHKDVMAQEMKGIPEVNSESDPEDYL